MYMICSIYVLRCNPLTTGDRYPTGGSEDKNLYPSGLVSVSARHRMCRGPGGAYLHTSGHG